MMVVPRFCNRLLLLSLWLGSLPGAAQTLGASRSLQVVQESGLIFQNSQVYVQQRGFGASNLSTITTIPVDSSLAPAAIAAPLPVISISPSLPSDFRLSITNTDQVQDTYKRTTIKTSAITITSSPLSIQLR